MEDSKVSKWLNLLNEDTLRVLLLLALWEREVRAVSEVEVSGDYRSYRFDLAFLYAGNVIIVECKDKLFHPGALYKFIEYSPFCDVMFILSPLYGGVEPDGKTTIGEVLKLKGIWLNNIANTFRDILTGGLSEEKLKKLSSLKWQVNLLRKFYGDEPIAPDILAKSLGRTYVDVKSGEVIDIIEAYRHIGIYADELRQILETGKVTCQHQIHETVRALTAKYFINKGCFVAVDQELPTTGYYRYVGAAAPRRKGIPIWREPVGRFKIDLISVEPNLVVHGIEVKSNVTQEVVEQLVSYIQSREFNYLWLAIPDHLQQWTLQTVRETDPRIGVITVNPITRTVNLAKEATMLSKSSFT
jgi:hypothetical protein